MRAIARGGVELRRTQLQDPQARDAEPQLPSSIVDDRDWPGSGESFGFRQRHEPAVRVPAQPAMRTDPQRAVPILVHGAHRTATGQAMFCRERLGPFVEIRPDRAVEETDPHPVIPGGQHRRRRLVAGDQHEVRQRAVGRSIDTAIDVAQPQPSLVIDGDRSDSSEHTDVGSGKPGEPAGLQPHQPLIGGDPERLRRIVVVERDQRVVGQPLLPAEIGQAGAGELKQAFVGGNERTASSLGDGAHVTGHVVAQRHRNHGIVRQPVQAERRADPDVAFAIFEERLHGIGR